MSTWTPQDWIVFLGAAATFLGTVTTMVLQIIGNLRTNQAKAISADNNEKLSAVVHQTNNIAAAVPGATTAPTDAVIAARNTGA